VTPDLRRDPAAWQRDGVRIEIDREKCMGSGNCGFWAPGVFDLDDEGIAIVVDPSAAPEEKILLAAEGCPTQAITVHRDDS
jgi:ferredoxin